MRQTPLTDPDHPYVGALKHTNFELYYQIYWKAILNATLLPVRLQGWFVIRMAPHHKDSASIAEIRLRFYCGCHLTRGLGSARRPLTHGEANQASELYLIADATCRSFISWITPCSQSHDLGLESIAPCLLEHLQKTRTAN
jgi:hypothetical protein